ncbi:MAG: GNAT family N-acetyltransferase [Planctomycetes bacterium]|nr:GNAT family N-acetyltransferase [Planctomycetota bacterium]
MDQAHAWLHEKMVRHASKDPQRLPDWNQNAAGIKAFYFRDPDGHFLEVLEFPPDKGDPKWHRKGSAGVAPAPLFLGIDHTAIVVGDTEASLRFYRDLLGFRVVGGGENFGLEQEALNNVPGAHLRITTLRAESGPAIEFLLADDADIPQCRGAGGRVARPKVETRVGRTNPHRALGCGRFKRLPGARPRRSRTSDCQGASTCRWCSQAKGIAMTAASTTQPFQIPQSSPGRLGGILGDALRNLCERVLAFPSLNAVYSVAQTPAEDRFCDRVLRSLGVDVQFSADDLGAIPTSGPLVVVANHPFGALDGLVLTALLQRVRPDVRVLANYVLARIPEMRATSLFVDPFGGPGAAIRNRAAMKTAVQWVAGGGALGVFPAGEVSHFTWKRGCVTDSPWSDAVARLALRTCATVVPVCFDGQNGRLFQVLGLIHPRLRTALLPRELLRLRGQTVRVEIGTPIRPQRLAGMVPHPAGSKSLPHAQAVQVTEYLRLRTYILMGRIGGRNVAKGGAKVPSKTVKEIAPAISGAQLAKDVAALPAEQFLATSGSLRVCFGRADQLPHVLPEIGRLRELTFRLVGEGTGRAIDLDRFDEHYLHLFVWDAATSSILGAYRMGQTDVLLRRFGAAGLYTRTLFQYGARLLDRLDPALELGRSFVIPARQRDYAPLLLLWKGVGRFVAMNPRYRRLFGAVSISDEFQSMTKQLLMAFLKSHRFDGTLAELVRPRTPPKTPRFLHADHLRLATLVSDVDQVEELVGEIESNRRSIPVLLRQYLKLNAKLLGFNIDPDFGDVLDGLVLVDLVTVERTILNRYLGPGQATRFLAEHSISPS